MQDSNASNEDRARLAATRAGAGDASPPLPPDLVREITTSLHSFAPLLPDDEMAALMQRIATLIHDRELEQRRQLAAAMERSRLPRPVPAVEQPSEMRARLWDAAREYGKFLELAVARAEVVQQARKAREEAAATRARIASHRAKRALDGQERTSLREAVRAYVSELKRGGSSLDDVLHSTGTLLRGLRITGDVADEAGAFEVDVQRMVAEEYCSAA